MSLYLAPDLEPVLDSLVEEVQRTCASRWPGVSVQRSTSFDSSVVVYWTDGPTAADVTAAVAPYSTVRCTVEVPGLPPVVKVSQVVRCTRQYSPRAQSLAAVLLGRSGFPSLPDFSYLRRISRPWTPSLLRDLEDLGIEDSLFEASSDLVELAEDALEPFELSGLPDVSGVSDDPALPFLVDLVERLAADAGVRDEGDLLLWAASGGFDLAVSLLPDPLRRAGS